MILLLSNDTTQGASGESGFSVLEAIMAVAILSIALLPLFEMQSQFVKTVAAYQRVQEKNTLERQVVNRISAINLYKTPEGREPFGDYVLIWSASDVTQASPNIDQDQVRNSHDENQILRGSFEKSRGRFKYSLKPVSVRLVGRNQSDVLQMKFTKFDYEGKYSFRDSIF